MSNWILNEPRRVAPVRGEVRRESYGRRLFVLRMISCGKVRCKKCLRGERHGPYWYEVCFSATRNFWHYRGRGDRFSPAEFVGLAKPNEEHESEAMNDGEY